MTRFRQAMKLTNIQAMKTKYDQKVTALDAVLNKYMSKKKTDNTHLNELQGEVAAAKQSLLSTSVDYVFQINDIVKKNQLDIMESVK